MRVFTCESLLQSWNAYIVPKGKLLRVSAVDKIETEPARGCCGRGETSLGTQQ